MQSFIPFHAPCTCSSIEAVNSWANDTRNCRKRNNCPKSAISFLLTIYSLSLSLGSQLQCPAGYLTSCNLAPEHLQCPATVVINSFADCDVEKMVILKIIFNLTVVILKIYKKIGFKIYSRKNLCCNVPRQNRPIMCF